MLVALRLGLGCHFLYEGVWKIRPFEKFSTKHAEPFTAEPFLTQAKGPLAGFFYMMVPDINAQSRLRVVTDVDRKKTIDSSGIVARWNSIQQDFVDYYKPAGSDSEAAKSAFEKLQQEADKSCKKSQEQLKEYFQENVDDIAAYLGALDRFENDKERNQTAPYQKQRRWDRMMELRGEAAKWIKDVEGQELALKDTLYSLLDDEQRQRGSGPINWNPLHWKQSEQIDFAVTYALTAIGICLMLGFCTRLAALGGAAFMCFVVMTQPAFVGFYPVDPHVVGHALMVNKDFIEMLALLTIATTAVGRWGGLDYFLYYWIFKPFCSCCVKKEQ
jgi:uncharacterized membrane protein YphA (DoxX/SURF4 family)